MRHFLITCAQNAEERKHPEQIRNPVLLMKKTLKEIAKGLLCFFLIILALITVVLVVGNITNRQGDVNTIAGQNAALSGAMKEAWKNTPSDIEGMSKWDKHRAGLSVATGSDTDGDGLTDKEEIEVYHSDPLKVSSSGDLYSDLYKLQNGMDLSRAYPYQDTLQFAHNPCPEVKLSAQIPTDFNAVVTERTDIDQLSGLAVYAAYEIYNYSGKFSVDLTDVLNRENLELSDIAVYVSDGSGLNSYSYTSEGNTITLKKNFSPKSTYTVYCAEKNFIRFAAAKLGATDALDVIDKIMEDEPEEITGAGLVYVSPILAEFSGSPITIYYEKLDTEEHSLALKNKILAHTKDFFHIGDEYSFSFKECSALEIEFTYNLFKSVVSFLDVTNMSHGDISLGYLFFMYYSYEDKLSFESQPNWEAPDASVDPEAPGVTATTDPVTGFDLLKDTLPFGNFKTEYSPNGSCAGISHLTAYLYNQKKFPSLSGDSSDISWNLEDDPENRTLYSPGLSDYKTEAFVQEHSTDNQTLSTNLTPGEEEFAKMIASAYLAGNQNAEFICYELFGGDFNAVTQDYSVIESAIAYLESGKILDVYLDMVDGTRHTVNLYGYRKESDNVVWFSVYDCNFPGNRTNGELVSDTGFNLRVEKKLQPSGNGWTFSFDYFPLENRSYGATSNPNISENNLIIILDEFGHLLND